jgi:hypothetical protein
MKWITRAHVHVDRVACPWLIKRFIDSQAEFLFVANDIVQETAEKEGAIPYDTTDAELGHKEGHCSFISIIEKYHLKDKALLALAEVVNAADTDSMDTNKYASGLEALARGFSLMYPMTMIILKNSFWFMTHYMLSLKSKRNL